MHQDSEMAGKSHALCENCYNKNVSHEMKVGGADLYSPFEILQNCSS